MEKTTLKIKGMTGENCMVIVRTALLELNGVLAVEVHLKEGNAKVTYDKNEVSSSDIQKVVEKQGYDVKV